MWRLEIRIFGGSRYTVEELGLYPCNEVFAELRRFLAKSRSRHDNVQAAYFVYGSQKNALTNTYSNEIFACLK